VEHEYALRLRKTCQPAPADQRAVDQLRHNPPGWSLSHYEQLAQLLSRVITESGDSSANVGDVKQYIDSLSVSSQSVCIIFNTYLILHWYYSFNSQLVSLERMRRPMRNFHWLASFVCLCVRSFIRSLLRTQV